MKNHQIKGEDGKLYWVHRNIAVSSFIFKIELTLNGPLYFILANKRGTGTPDNQGKWNCPCGYLDFDETLNQAASREIFEECGLRIDPNKLTMLEINDNPDSHMQNVTVRYFCTLFSGFDNITLEERKGGEENEVEEVQWINVKSIDDYEWAYNHDKIIKRIMS